MIGAAIYDKKIIYLLHEVSIYKKEISGYEE